MKTDFFGDVDKLFFTSDQHFGHKGVLYFCERPHADVMEMNHDLTRRWNEKVPKDGIVFVLGDFCWGGRGEWIHHINALNGHIYLVVGNHDKSIPGERDGKFTVMGDLAAIKVPINEKDRQYIMMCHYPMMSWYRSHLGAWHLYGHMHGRFNKAEFAVVEKIRPTALEVGIDTPGDYTPYSYAEVAAKINERIENEQYTDIQRKDGCKTAHDEER
jgi:calcineurin-like phosphoesterase family protein